jgi:CHAT domain-containing protein/tetratricopeptide (TPR) repeat protein
MALKRSLFLRELISFVCLAGLSVSTVLGQAAEKTIPQHERDLKQSRAAHDRAAEANALRSLGEAYNDKGDPQKAMGVLDEALPIYREVKDRRGEAADLTAIGESFLALRQYLRALQVLERALAMHREAGDKDKESVTLSDIGDVYAETGQPQRALDFHTQALTLEREAGNRGDEAVTLNNIGADYSDTGQPRKALDSYSQALTLERKAGNRNSEAITLHSIGTLYAAMGQPQKASDLYHRALTLERQVGNRGAEANTLSNIAGVYMDLHQFRTSLVFYNQALYIHHGLGESQAEAMTLTNIGAAYAFMGQPRKAQGFYKAAIRLEKEGEDRLTRAYTLWGLASLENDDALEGYLAALDIAQAAGNPDWQGLIESSLMDHFRRHEQLEAAIFFGKQAVNHYQQIRNNMKGLDSGLVASFVRSKSDTYRQLAELLAQQDRLTEAERVLDLLKEQELKETVRGAIRTMDGESSSLPISDADRKGATDLANQESEANNLVALAEERDTLQANEARSAAEEARLDSLNAEIAKGNAAIRHFFDQTLFAELGGTANANKEVSLNEEESSSIRSELRRLPQGTVAVYTIVTDQHTYLILITPAIRVKREARLSGQQLRAKVLQVREELRNPRSQPQEDLQDLYDALIGPILPDLKAADARTILWSLDGVLRYLPMNALYDGTQYLLQQYNSVVITPASRNHLLDTAKSTDWRLLAMGLSKSYLGEQPLAGVDVELNAIVRDPRVETSHGPMPGRLLENDAFTLATFQELSMKFPLVHVASHFIFDPGNVPEPYLLLGGDTTGGAGYRLTTSEMSDKLEFTGVQLLTLSACSTALADKLPNGREMDSLGMIAQKNDAAAVISTLWDVNDNSTSFLMSDFYTRWLVGKGATKGEALRQAQLGLLHKSQQAVGPAARGTRMEPTSNAATPNRLIYAHPYYWAPFVLIGNFQ